MQCFAVVVFLFSFTILPSHANLGETIAQCVARYGKPVNFTEASAKTPFGTVTFVAAGYGLTIFVANGKEVGARVTKVDKSPLSDTDLQNIMAAESGPSAWTPTKSKDPTCLEWTRSDKAEALYDKEKHMLIFTSQEMARIMDAPAAAPNPGN